MNIIIHSVQHDSEDGLRFVVAEFTVDGELYGHRLADGGLLDRSSLDLDHETLNAIQEALDEFIHDQAVDTELYDIDELTQQAQLLGYRQGKRYVLDQIGETVQLVEVTERYRTPVAAFNNRTECALWLQLNEPQLGKGPVKRVNANIPEALHDDFKALCVRRKVDMQDVLAKLIVQWMQ